MDDTDRERWRGGVDKDMERNADDIKTLYRLSGEQATNHQDLRLVVNTISTKLVVYAGVGGMLGSGIMSVIVGWFFKH